jgi:hypothetical protein
MKNFSKGVIFASAIDSFNFFLDVLVVCYLGRLFESEMVSGGGPKTLWQW